MYGILLLLCEKGEGNGYDANTLAVVYDNIVKKRVVEHISKLLSKTMVMFLSLPKTRITCEITGKSEQRSSRLWLGDTLHLAFTNSVVIRKLFLGLIR